MNAKHITNLIIRNFRGFEDLELSGLQAVNLIVGENNSGKTSFLEALAAVANPQAFQQLPGLFRANESHSNPRFFRWVLRDAPDVVEGFIEATGPELGNRINFYPKMPPNPAPDAHVHQSARLQAFASPSSKELRCCAVSVHHGTPDSLVKSFGDAVRPSAGEEIMHEVLRAVDPRIKRIRVDPTEHGNIIAVDVGLSESIPLSQAGQGIFRLVAILSVLLGMKPQLCVIDEIENGIHYTALPRMWRGLAKVSELLGIQIFATTHSKECLEAAHRVFCAEDEARVRDLAVIQIMRVHERIMARTLDEEHIEAAVEIDIELR
ncbi:MAG: AAA family ATPase [Verrucomicrobia bacterium]|nr:AAA family ATPase [Verrucomicrobiota bacterium]